MKPARHHQPCQHKFYRMTCAQFDELFAAAGGACQICGIVGTETAHGLLFIDHDSDIGLHGVRGLLCCSCNSRLTRAPRLRTEAEERYLSSPWHPNFEPTPIRWSTRWSGPREQVRLIVAGRTR